MGQSKVRYVLSKVFIDNYTYVHVVERNVFDNIEDLIKQLLLLDGDFTFFISDNALPTTIVDGEWTYIIYTEDVKKDTGGVMFEPEEKAKNNSGVFQGQTS